MKLGAVTLKVGVSPLLVLAARASAKDIYEDIQTEDGNIASIYEDSKNEEQSGEITDINLSDISWDNLSEVH